MDKNEYCVTFYNEYMKLSESGRENFSMLCNKILKHTFLTAHTSVEKDKRDYYAIAENITIYQSYFALIDCILTEHKPTRTLILKDKNQNNSLKFTYVQSIIFLSLLKLYHIKNAEISLRQNILITMEELHQEIQVLGDSQKKKTISTLTETIRLFKKYNLCELDGDIKDDDTRIIVYPTIQHVYNVDEIALLEKKLSEYVRKEKIDNEEDFESENN